MRSAVFGCVWLLLVLSGMAWAQEAAPAAPPAMEQARAQAANGDWGGAIDAYTDYLRNLTTRDFRDKKTFTWILDEFEAQSGEKPDYDAFKQVVKGKLTKSREKRDALLNWRLHALLAEIARRQGDLDETGKELGIAIDWYPDSDYGEPATQSRLQHLYNEAALLRADADLAAGEGYLLEKFLRDDRFNFIYLPPWESFHEAKGTSEAYLDFARRVVEAYDEKAKRIPAKADMLTHYRSLAEQELPQPAESASEQP